MVDVRSRTGAARARAGTGPPEVGRPACPRCAASDSSAGAGARWKGGPAASVVIPAHNEAPALARLLDDVLHQECEGPLQIVVVANGCTDGTAAVARQHVEAARRHGHALTVLDLPRANKAGALNAGEASCPPGIHLFVDADVGLSAGAIPAVVALLQPGTGVHFCAPAIRAARSGSRAVRSYFRLWSQLPYVSEQVIGCGFYAVSPGGRARWGAFPDIISDDKFARLHFSPSERSVASEGRFFVYFPETFRELVRVRGRWCRGNSEVRRAVPLLARNDRSRYVGTLAFLARHPGLWLDVPIFAWVFCRGTATAATHRSTGTSVWERADSSRVRQTGGDRSTVVAPPRSAAGEGNSAIRLWPAVSCRSDR